MPYINSLKKHVHNTHSSNDFESKSLVIKKTFVMILSVNSQHYVRFIQNNGNQTISKIYILLDITLLNEKLCLARLKVLPVGPTAACSRVAFDPPPAKQPPRNRRKLTSNPS